MNKLLLILLSIFSFQTFAQETIHFNMHYKPETKYIGETIMSMELITIHTGTDSFMSYFRETGIDSVLIVNEIVKGKIELKVLSKGEQGAIPVEMKYISLETNGEENKLLAGLTATGTVEGHNLPVLVSVKNSNFDSSFENDFLSMINQMFEQIKFPNITLAIGESFKDTMPFVMPVGNTEMTMELKTVYLLKEINNKKALFDIVQFGDISFTESGKNYIGEFKGSGYAYYDLEFDIIDESKLDYSFDTNYISNYNNLQILLKGEFSQKFEIQKL